MLGLSRRARLVPATRSLRLACAGPIVQAVGALCETWVGAERFDAHPEGFWRAGEAALPLAIPVGIPAVEQGGHLQTGRPWWRRELGSEP